MKKWNDKAKKAVIAAGAGAAAAAILAGLIFGLRGGGEPVGVYPFSMVGMTEFWGDNQESYGPVTTDRIQTVFLSDTQTITEVLVKEGDKVKKGDVLMTYDTTLSELQLERKRLDVEKAKLQVKEAEEELARIHQMKPMGSVDIYPPTGDVNWGETISGDYEILTQDSRFDGSSQDRALVCWVKGDTPINNALLRTLYYQAVENQYRNEQTGVSSASAIPEQQTEKSQTDEVQPEDVKPEDAKPEDVKPEDVKPEASQPDEVQPDDVPLEDEEHPYDGELTAGSASDVQPQLAEEPEKPEIYSPHLLFSGSTLTITKNRAVNLTFINRKAGDVVWSLESDTEGELVGKPSGRGFVVYGIPTKSEIIKYTVKAVNEGGEGEYKFNLEIKEPPEAEKEVNGFDIVLKKTTDNREKAPIEMWQGVHVTVYNGDAFGISFFDAPDPSVFFPEESESEETISTTPDSGKTAAEIAKLGREQEKKLKELAAAAKMTESEYHLMVREFTDGNIRADLDGEVVRLLSEEEARQTKQPVMKVSGGGGFYVQGSVSELEKGRLKLGQEVTVNDWNTGMTYTGQVESIGDFPVQSEGWNGVGNPNASYYPFRVFIDGTADLQEGSYVSVTYSAAEAENGVYLENPFLRTDDGDPYVYVRGKNGRLEKRAVTTGKSLWGSFTEIRSGLTAEDYVAFPYGKTVKPGAATVESDLSALYGY